MFPLVACEVGGWGHDWVPIVLWEGVGRFRRYRRVFWIGRVVVSQAVKDSGACPWAPGCPRQDVLLWTSHHPPCRFLFMLVLATKGAMGWRADGCTRCRVTREFGGPCDTEVGGK